MCEYIEDVKFCWQEMVAAPEVIDAPVTCQMLFRCARTEGEGASGTQLGTGGFRLGYAYFWSDRGELMDLCYDRTNNSIPEQEVQFRVEADDAKWNGHPAQMDFEVWVPILGKQTGSFLVHGRVSVRGVSSFTGLVGFMHCSSGKVGLDNLRIRTMPNG